MTSPTTWRPPARVRPLAIALLRRGPKLLVMAVRDDDGGLKGWRPLGGTIEFGERAEAALCRELLEEIGQPIKAQRLLTVMENLYDHLGTPGHEIVFVFEAAFADPAAYASDHAAFVDGGVHNDVAWVDIGRFRTGADKLLPRGLLPLLGDVDAG